MSILHAILMGILQGLTEFMPISSSTVVALFAEGVYADDVPYLLMSAVLHLGSLCAALWMLRRSFYKIFRAVGLMIRDIFGNLAIWFRNTRKGENISYTRILGSIDRQLAGMVCAASLPCCVIGFLLRKTADAGDNLLLVGGMGFFATSILLLTAHLAPHIGKGSRELSMRVSLLVGVIAGFAVLPGISRLAAVYAAAQLFGMHRKTAARFAVLSCFPVTLGAVLYELAAGTEDIIMSGNMAAQMILGGLFAMITCVVTIKWVIRLLRARSVMLFSLMNAAAGLIAVTMYIIR